MDYGLIQSIGTVATVLAFAGICWWAYRPGNRRRFEDDALLPLQTDPILASAKPHAGEESK